MHVDEKGICKINLLKMTSNCVKKGNNINVISIQLKLMALELRWMVGFGM